MKPALALYPLMDFPRIVPGDNLGAIMVSSLRENDLLPGPGDVLIVAQKVVSKAEGRYMRLSDVVAGSRAQEIAALAGKDPRVVELILRESRSVLRVVPGIIIVEHRLGYIHANAGIDSSNLPQDSEDPQVLLLPEDPDGSARYLQRSLEEAFGAQVPVIINDSMGRAWRKGTVGLAIGAVGMTPLHNQVGEKDLYDNILQATETAIIDELAAAASLVMGQAAEGRPAVLARGVDFTPSAQGFAGVLREPQMDLFR